MMRAVSYEMKDLIQPPFIAKHALLMGCLCSREPKLSDISDPFPDRLKRFGFVVTRPRGFLDGWPYATTPSSHHICDMGVGHSSMRGAQAESKITSAFV